MDSSELTRKNIAGLREIKDFLRIVSSTNDENLEDHVDRCYRVHIQPHYSSQHEHGKIVNFWCFSPKFGMNYLLKQKIRCFVLTSASLAPLSSLINELEIPIPIELTNPHIIQPNQVFVQVLPNGPDGEMLVSDYRNR